VKLLSSLLTLGFEPPVCTHVFRLPSGIAVCVVEVAPMVVAAELVLAAVIPFGCEE
jgi:hypothetical protein